MRGRHPGPLEERLSVAGRPGRGISETKVFGAALAGAAAGLSAAVAAFFIGFQQALSWGETAVVFTVLSLVPAALLAWRGKRNWRVFALGLASLWLAFAVLWIWEPGSCLRDDGPVAGPGAEGGCPPF
jgi:hypothetical protein